MNGVSKGLTAFFGGVGVLMVLISREFKDRGGDLGSAASTFFLIGTIWTAVAIFLLLVRLGIVRSERRSTEAGRVGQPDGPDVTR